MPASLATVNAITKELYTGRIRTQLQNESVGFKRIEKTSEGVEDTVGGKYVTFPIKVRRNVGLGYRNENEQLMTAGQQGYAQVRTGLKYGYGRVRLSGQVMELVETNAQAFASAMDMEMSGLKDDIAKDTNRIFYGNGTGAMATLTTAPAASATFTVASPKYLTVGDVVDIVTLAGPVVKATARTITVIVGTTVTVDAVVTAAIGDLVVRTGNINREPNGLGSIVTATGTLFNVDPAVEPIWAATVNGNAGVGRALSESLMISLTDQVRIKGGKTSLILTSLGVRRAYFNLLVQQRQFTDTKSFAGGIQGLEFHNGRSIPVVDDPDAPDGTMYFLDEDSLKIYRKAPWSWKDPDGSIWKWVHDFDAFEALLYQYWEIGVTQRNANAVLQDITEG